MAVQSINLLQPDELSSAEKKGAFFLKIGTIFLIVAYCLVVVAIFSFGLVVNRESQAIADKVEFEKTRLSDLQEVESLQFLLKDRLVSLAEVIELDGLKPKYWLNYLDSLAPEGVGYDSVAWEADGTVKISGIAGNAIVLADFLEKLKQATDNKKIASSILVSATRQTEGVYDFNLEILIKEQ